MNAIMISTARTDLTLIRESDCAQIHELLIIPEVDKYNTLGIPKSVAETTAIMKPSISANENGGAYTFGVRIKGDDAFIGLVGIVPGKTKYQSAEVYFKYFPAFWGKGYATEVLNGLIDFCFDDLNLRRVEAGCAVDNIASYKVMEKVGMIREGRKRLTLPLSTGWSDNFEYAILKNDKRHK